MKVGGGVKLTPQKKVSSKNPALPGLNLKYWSRFEEEALDIQTTIECRFLLKCICDMILTYIQMNRIDMYSQHSSIS